MEVEHRMAVDAEIKRSFFTQQLASRLEQDGITTPAFVLDLLDKPFASFSDEDKKIYETHVKDKELLVLFARLLQDIYEASGQSAKHSWKGMCHILKDSPIKVCVSFVLNEEEKQSVQEAETPPTRGMRTTAPPPGTGEETGPPGSDVSRKSFFTKKLERKLQEREIKVPNAIIVLLDKPFDDFTAEEQQIYETEFKGRQLTILFSDLLDELYGDTGRVASGWNALCRYLKDTPMKLIATYVLQEEERLEEVAKAPMPEQQEPQPLREKYNVKRYQSKETGSKEPQSRWHKKS